MVAGAGEILDRAQLGRVSTLFCEDVVLARRQLRAAAEELDPVPTLVAVEWESAPPLARELDEIRDALADAAASLWPAWYATAEQRIVGERRTARLDDLIAEIGAACPGASGCWLREAFRRCESGKRPVLRQVASAEQVRQLSLALDPARLIFALSVERVEAPAARLRALARAAEWLAREAHAKTLLLVPQAWRGNAELDPVTYGAIFLDRDAPYPTPGASERPPAESAPPQVVVGPIVGKPHPGSEVEQLVCTRLARDAELGSLFEFNQRLSAFGDKHYIVDLLWRRGRLVVELDGPEHHGQVAYVKDRDRDYRLFMSGYTTLRVSNAEVCVDVEAVMAKIRNVVRQLGPSAEGNR